jgi:hypothetical protein
VKCVMGRVFNVGVFFGVAALFALLGPLKRRRTLAGCSIAILAVQLGVLPVTLSDNTSRDNDSLPQEVLPVQLSSTNISFSRVSSTSAQASIVAAQVKPRQVPAASGPVEYIFPAGPTFSQLRKIVFSAYRPPPVV